MSKKYNYTNQIMQQVSKYCDMGYYPICKFPPLANDKDYYFGVFTWSRDEFGVLKRSEQCKDVRDCKSTIGQIVHADYDEPPVAIIGFYHPPFKPFKVGDKVRVREDLEDLQCDGGFDNSLPSYQKSAGKIGTIETTNEYYYYIRLEDGSAFVYGHHQLEPYLEEEPTKKSVTLELTDEQLQKIKEMLNQ